MANLREIRNRIKSVASTRQITNAMKMVSAAKLKKAQDAIIRIRPYADKLHEILKHFSDCLSADEENLYACEREIKRVLVVVFTSNRGLCGAFNASIIRRTIEMVLGEYRKELDRNNVDFLAIGKRGFEFLKKHNFRIIAEHNYLLDEMTFQKTVPVAREIMKNYAEGNYDRVMLVYYQFRNAAVQILQTERFLPVELPEEDPEALGTQTDYIFEPNREHLVRELIPRSLQIQFYKALLDSNASEHGARMIAMHQATDNATGLIRELRLQYNKVRQADITREILEIVSGAEALKGIR